MASTLQLVNGPSKFDLMLALFSWKPEPREVFFEDVDGRRIPFRVLSVGVEDGSGESWNIEGIADAPGLREMRAVETNPKYEVRSNHRQVYFRTDTRKGHLRLD